MRVDFLRLCSVWIHGLQGRWDRHGFQRQRIDYYDYLASLLNGLDGLRTLKDVFLQDALRYGKNSLRGRLSHYWLDTYQRAGGDLYATWEDHLPRIELALIRAAQSLGSQALVRTLAELSCTLKVLQGATRILWGTLWPAGLALCIAILISLAVPWFTLPQLLNSFAGLPSEYYGTLTRRLVGFASFVGDYFPGIFFVSGAGIAYVVSSLPNAAGPIRKHFDDYLWWKVYRHINALRFLAFLRISLGDDDFASIQLRSALLRLRRGSSPWLSHHIDMMLERLDRGVAGPDTFDTGLFTREQFWFLTDMILARGLATGLTLARDRIQQQILTAVARQAVVMRWATLLSCVAYVLGLVLWHYAVIDELRRALTFYFIN